MLSETKEYEAFVEKFKPKKTTDDCYTPEIIYNAVLDWCVKTYVIKGRQIARPFYPGGDYENFDYSNNPIVIDNPPFSIISKIVRFYDENKIDFFLFAPFLTLFSGNSAKNPSVKYVVTGNTITYENGAKVSTAFITNLGENKLWACSELFDIIKQAEFQNTRQNKKQLPKYSYPPNVVTSHMLGYLASHGVEWKYKGNAHFCRELDNQKKFGKSIFGSGFLISDKAAAEKAAAEKAAAEKAAAEKWKLSDRELAIIAGLGKTKLQRSEWR